MFEFTRTLAPAKGALVRLLGPLHRLGFARPASRPIRSATGVPA